MSYIEKEPIIEFITKGLNNPDKNKAFGYDAIEILTEIEYSPTADVVEVVRCKDCRHWHRTCFDPLVEHWEGECLHHKIEVMFENDFCSDGERRTN